jgi:hypothetical protein
MASYQWCISIECMALSNELMAHVVKNQEYMLGIDYMIWWK